MSLACDTARKGERGCHFNGKSKVGKVLPDSRSKREVGTCTFTF